MKKIQVESTEEEGQKEDLEFGRSKEMDRGKGK